MRSLLTAIGHFVCATHTLHFVTHSHVRLCGQASAASDIDVVVTVGTTSTTIDCGTVLANEAVDCIAELPASFFATGMDIEATVVAQIRDSRSESAEQKVTLRGSPRALHVVDNTLRVWVDLPKQPKLESQAFQGFVYASLAEGEEYLCNWQVELDIPDEFEVALGSATDSNLVTTLTEVTIGAPSGLRRFSGIGYAANPHLLKSTDSPTELFRVVLTLDGSVSSTQLYVLFWLPLAQQKRSVCRYDASRS